MLLLLSCIAQAPPCGTGTHDSGGTCVADNAGDSGQADTSSDADADTDTDTDADTDADSDADSDTDSDSDTDADTASGPCAPPDAWTGTVDAALYTSVPWDSTYDAGLADLAANLPSGSVSTSSEASWLIYGATVVATDGYTDDNYPPRMYVADANDTILVEDDDYSPNAAVGDKVGFATSWLGSYYDERRVERTSGFTVLSSGNPVYVRELGAENLDYLTGFAILTHVYGEITRTSSYDCGNGFACYILDHDGTTDLIRVATNNDWGLGPDYSGGTCGEVIAPVSMYGGTDGDATYLDVWGDEMRTWPKP